MQRELFATELFAEQEVKEDLHPIFDLLRDAIEVPWNDYRERVQHDRAFAMLPAEGVAQWLHYQIVDRAAELVQARGRHDLTTYEIKKIFVVEFKDTYQISFKKLNQRLERSNYRTKHNADYWRQRLLPGFRDTIRLIVGYKTKNAGTEIEIHITAPRLFSVAWSFPLPEKAVSRRLRIADLKTHPAPRTKKGFKIKAKKATSKKKHGQT